MKQRFSISRDTGGEKIVIMEYAELDKGVYSLLCTEAYAVAALEAVLDKDSAQIMAALRTQSFFPTQYCAEKLVTTLRDYIREGAHDPVKFDTDDSECIHSLTPAAPGDENGGLDELLDVESEAHIDDVEPVEKLDAPLKIAVDETAEISNSL